MDIVYLVGPPAVGKSTLMAALTAGCERYPQSAPFRHDLLYDSDGLVAAELGARRAAFSGTDALAMNVAPAVQHWLPLVASSLPLLLAEGDRLAHRSFLDAAAAAGYGVNVVHLALPPVALAARHAQRGSAQNEAWRKGRATKAERLAAYAADRYHLARLDAAAAPVALVAAARAAVPALEALPA